MAPFSRRLPKFTAKALWGEINSPNPIETRMITRKRSWIRSKTKSRRPHHGVSSHNTTTNPNRRNALYVVPMPMNRMLMASDTMASTL